MTIILCSFREKPTGLHITTPQSVSAVCRPADALCSLTLCPATASPSSPSFRLHFLLVYLLCRRSQASNWLVGLICPAPSSSLSSSPLPSLGLSLKRLLINPSDLLCESQRGEKRELNRRTDREREHWGKRQNKREMGCLCYAGIKLCDLFDKRNSLIVDEKRSKL